MRTKTKALTLALCAVLLVVTTIFATMAYLTSQASVTNTFTVGKVAITLDEAKVNIYGERLNDQNEVYEEGDTLAGRVTTNNYKLIPGHTYIKDPMVHVSDDSEKCWLFIKLENGLKDIIDNDSIETQMGKKGWTCIDESNNIWAYNKIANPKDNIDVFDNFILKGDADVSKYATASSTDADGNPIGGKKIEVTAYAIQADGFENADDAWDACGLLNN